MHQRRHARRASGRRIDVPTALFDNPYQLSPLRFRADGRTLAFRYVERGHRRVRLIEVDAYGGQARTVAEEHAKTKSGSSSMS